jgi:hypothetical protein
LKLRAEGIDPKLLDMNPDDPCPKESELLLPKENAEKLELKQLGPVPTKPTKVLLKSCDICFSLIFSQLVHFSNAQ